MDAPHAISRLIEDRTFERVNIGCSKSEVFRALHPHKPLLYLKIERILSSPQLAREADRLRWLHGRLSAPELLSYCVENDQEYLLMTALSGCDGVEAGASNAEAVVAGLARSLRDLHSQPIDECPFDETLLRSIAYARDRVRLGQVDESDFDEERRGRSAADLFSELESFTAPAEDHVLTHGDPCLPNIIFDERIVPVGFVDCGRLGVADRYRDLALAAHSIRFNLGPQWVEPFFTEYGLANPDERKLALYRLLDEFF